MIICFVYLSRVNTTLFLFRNMKQGINVESLIDSVCRFILIEVCMMH